MTLRSMPLCLEMLNERSEMKTPPDNPEFARFTDALRHMLKVPKTEMNRRIEAEKKRRPKHSASRASGASGPSHQS